MFTEHRVTLCGSMGIHKPATITDGGLKKKLHSAGTLWASSPITIESKSSSWTAWSRYKTSRISISKFKDNMALKWFKEGICSWNFMLKKHQDKRLHMSSWTNFSLYKVVLAYFLTSSSTITRRLFNGFCKPRFRLSNWTGIHRYKSSLMVHQSAGWRSLNASSNP